MAQEIREHLQLFLSQFRWTMSVGFAPPRFSPSSRHVRHPFADRRFADPEGGGNSPLFPPLPLEFKRSFASRFLPIIERDTVLPHATIMTQEQNFPDLCNGQ
jgi:hypothetical protein